MLSQLSYTPTWLLIIILKHAGPFEKRENDDLSYGRGPRMEAVSTSARSQGKAEMRDGNYTVNIVWLAENALLKPARTGGVRTEILKGCNLADFVRHDGEFGQLGHAEGSRHCHVGGVAARGH